jgi:hypothetical protein
MSSAGQRCCQAKEGKRMGEPVAEVIRAQRFELVDAEGNVRGALGLDEDGNPRVCLCDKEGHVRGGLRLDRDGMPHLCALAESGSATAELGFGTSWRAGLVLTDYTGQVLWSAIPEHV